MFYNNEVVIYSPLSRSQTSKHTESTTQLQLYISERNLYPVLHKPKVLVLKLCRNLNSPWKTLYPYITKTLTNLFSGFSTHCGLKAEKRKWTGEEGMVQVGPY